MTQNTRTKQQKAILEALNAPGGRARANADIARQVGCGARSVAYVRCQHPTPEVMERTMAVMDELMPGIYRWWVELEIQRDAREAEEVSP